MSYFEYVTQKRNDTHQSILFMESVAQSLNNEVATGEAVSLVGLIQSGKTRTFVGIMAKCFDLGFDTVILFTKVSKALVQQTINRMNDEFEEPINASNLWVWNAIKLDDSALNPYILSHKNIFVTKKEKANLNKLHNLFDNELKDKKILIVDDEADANSVTYIAPDEMAVISSSLSDLRQKAKGHIAYLQVTATPYSLYLQPDSAQFNEMGYSPLRPKQTFVLEAHPAYIGGKYYFEDSSNQNSPAAYLFHEISQDEMNYLNQKAKTKTTYNKKLLSNVLETDYIKGLRESIYLFLVGGAIRFIAEQNTHMQDLFIREYKCAFLMHTSQQKVVHKMQKDLVEKIINELSKKSKEELKNIFSSAIANIKGSVSASDTIMPSTDAIIDRIFSVMKMLGVKIVEVNSDADINNQLGKDGQLRLDNPYNIFIGGQSLDRGITIDHLIGAFYGRDPKRFQMDTVLQHSRMYGARSTEDLSVTRFSTTNLIYETMKNMHFFDKDLREMLKKGAPIVFIAKLDNKIIPCGPQKTLASNMISFRPGSRLLPIGFQTKCKTTIGKTIDFIEQSINNAPLCEDQNKYLVHKMSVSEISDILRKINDTFEYSDRFGNNELGWDIEAHIAALEKTANEKKEVLVYSLKTLKLVSRTRISGFQDAPDDGRTDTPICKNLAKTTPVVMLLKVDGSSKEGKNHKDRGWNGADFYWPVIVLPENSKNYVYTPNSGL